MTERMIKRFGSQEAAAQAFADVSLEELKEAIDSLPNVSPALKTRTFRPISRQIDGGSVSKWNMGTAEALAYMRDSEILLLKNFGPEALDILNRALEKIADEPLG